MSDSYIDPRETQIYGAFAREQFDAVCLGLVPALDGAVKFAGTSQATADAAMKLVLDRQPAPTATGGDPVADARDSVVRFGKYVESVKGAPVPLASFFEREVPSVAARRRLLKLIALVKHVAARIEHHGAALPNHQEWLAEFRAHAVALTALEAESRSKKVDAAMLRPEIVDAREDWLAVYTANKALITGVLRHANRLELLPLVFDDLAQQHRAVGVSDDVPEPPPVDPPPVG